MKTLIIIIVIFFSNFVHAEETLFSDLKIVSNTPLKNFTTTDIKKCIFRLTDNMIYVLDHSENILWQFTANGSFRQKLLLNDLPLQLVAPVKGMKARVTDFCPQKNGNIILSEGNTASIYEIDMNGRVINQIKMNNSPLAVNIIDGDTIIVIDQDFHSKYLRLMLTSGKILAEIKFDKSQIKTGFKEYNTKIDYFFIKKNVLFIFASINNEILKCVITGANIIIESKYWLSQPIKSKYIGYNGNSHKLWVKGIAMNGDNTYVQIDCNSKKIKYTTDNLYNSFIGIGIQKFDFYYYLTPRRLISYAYK